MNNLEWLAGYKAFLLFASWARRHGFYVEVLDRMCWTAWSSLSRI